MIKKRTRKGELTWHVIALIIIAVLVLVLSLILYAKLSGKGIGAIEFFKNLWRFGRG